MNSRFLVNFSLKRPRLIIAVVVLLSVGFLSQLPKIQVDTNPKNMLPASSEVRVWNNEVDRSFGLYEDTIVVGIVHPETILNPGTLGRIQEITLRILTLKGVAARDVTSFTTIDNVNADRGGLTVRPLVSSVPQKTEQLEALRKTLFENPLFVNRVISRDGKTAAIYVPLEKGANGKQIADEIRLILRDQKGNERYYIAGDPVARDTFGAEMFKLMGMFAPISGMIMFVILLWMFRSFALAMTMMAAAMVSIIWSMGALIGLGFPVHIMSSMAPVFLMAIATDSIHIFNEFFFRYRESRDKKQAIQATMAAVGQPVGYTALATAAGFAVLLFMQIIPVKLFGAVVVFGTVVLRLLSFSLIPAALSLLNPEKLLRKADADEAGSSGVGRSLGRLAAIGANHPRKTATTALLLVILAGIGMAPIVVNNNQVEWFLRSSEVRQADEVLNRNLGGTALGYIIAVAKEPDAIKRPATLAYIEGLQRRLESMPEVGKTVSVVDYVKRINRVLHEDNPAFDRIPDEKDTVSQYLFVFGMSAKQSDLDNVVDYPYQRANIWVQLKTWDAIAMRKVIQVVDDYRRTHPTDLELKPAGPAYFNVVWNDEVLWDMVKGFGLALVVVFLLLAITFRSYKWALIGYVPLLFTIALIYGAIGFLGKDFDMPISVLSCLSLGMAVDFPIHFISRFRQRLQEMGAAKGFDVDAITAALTWTAARPGKGIVRNAVLFAAAFSVMLFAPLTPYITVGAFIVVMMLMSALATLIFLPALVVLLRPWLYSTDARLTNHPEYSALK